MNLTPEDERRMRLLKLGIDLDHDPGTSLGKTLLRCVLILGFIMATVHAIAH